MLWYFGVFTVTHRQTDSAVIIVMMITFIAGCIVCDGFVCGGVRYVPDTDDEFYDRDKSEDSDVSDDSNTSKKDDEAVTASTSQSADSQSRQLKRRLSDADDPTNRDSDTDAAGSSIRCKDGSVSDRVSVDTGQVKRLDDDVDNKPSADCEVADNKRRKLDDSTKESASNINCHGTYECCDVKQLLQSGITTD